MKKLIAIIAAALLILSLTVTVSADRGLSYKAPKGTPTVDAEAEAAWDNAAWIHVDLPDAGGRPATASTLRIKLMWDEQNLYFLADVFDDEYYPNGDIVEIYVDESNDKKEAYGRDDSQTRFTLAGEILKGAYAGPNSKADSTCAARLVEKGRLSARVVLEGALPWATIEPSAGAELAIEFMYNDVDEWGEMLDAYRWNVDTASGETPPYESTEHFGKLLLVAAAAALTGLEEEEDPVPSGTYGEPESSVPASSDPVSSVATSSQSDPADNGFPTTAVIICAAAAVLIVAAAVIILAVKKKKK